MRNTRKLGVVVEQPVTSRNETQSGNMVVSEGLLVEQGMRSLGQKGLEVNERVSTT